MPTPNPASIRIEEVSFHGEDFLYRAPIKFGTIDTSGLTRAGLGGME